MLDAVEDRQPIEDTGSLSDHESTFSGGKGVEVAARVPAAAPSLPEPVEEQEPVPQTAEEEARDPNGRFRTQPKGQRHRAQSQKAGPADVPRIAELTRKLREAEEKLAAQTVQPRAPEPVLPQPVAPVASRTAPAAHPEKFAYPSYEKALEGNPSLSYDDWQDGKLDAWGIWRDGIKEQQTAKAAEERRAHDADVAEYQRVQGLQTSYQQRVASFIKTAPDFQARIDAAKDAYVPGVFMQAIQTAENGPQLVYTLTQRPDLLAEMHLIGDGKPVTPQTVAAATLWLTTRVQAGITGAAVTAATRKPASRPPTPVKTSPLQTGAEPPDEGATLASHEQFYHKPRR